MRSTDRVNEYYAKKSKQDKAMFSEKLKKVQDDDDVKKKAQHQQDSIIEMMKMLMRDAQDRADKQLDDAVKQATVQPAVWLRIQRCTSYERRWRNWRTNSTI
ncbi:hypothetical protein OS493_007809 [Desmophyllum pertusum]|uniref:Uncharacterized protein n=1 Tax=Desmophyllum pertusum TaxID=174260 RepID=A0A9X0CM32_9CNID|nr:hypothetical protein OS493_007809 [Desmophyllum pertusum]